MKLSNDKVQPSVVRYGAAPLGTNRKEAEDAWELLCALAELILGFTVGQQRVDALMKFSKVVGKVVVKIAVPDGPASESSDGQTVVSDQPITGPDASLRASVNAWSILNALGVSSFDIGRDALLSILSKREFRGPDCALFSVTGEAVYSIRAQLPESWGRVSVLDDAVLRIQKAPDRKYSAIVTFGSVRLKQHPESNYRLTARTSDREVVIEDLSDRGAPQRIFRIELGYKKSLRGLLTNVGIRLTSDSKTIAGFFFRISIHPECKVSYLQIIVEGDN